MVSLISKCLRASLLSSGAGGVLTTAECLQTVPSWGLGTNQNYPMFSRTSPLPSKLFSQVIDPSFFKDALPPTSQTSCHPIMHCSVHAPSFLTVRSNETGPFISTWGWSSVSFQSTLGPVTQALLCQLFALDLSSVSFPSEFKLTEVSSVLKKTKKEQKPQHHFLTILKFTYTHICLCVHLYVYVCKYFFERLMRNFIFLIFFIA